MMGAATASLPGYGVDPVARARQVIEQLGLEHPDELDVELVANYHDVYVKYRRLPDHEGHLLRDGRVGLVVVDEGARDSEKWRFVIGHELGHFFLHPSHDQFELCTADDLQPGRTDIHRREREANAFAAELLMPRHLFEPRLHELCQQRPGADLHMVRHLARTFRTSLTATALHFVAYCPRPCALVYVGPSGRVDWASTSASFVLRLRPRRPLSPGTHVYDLLHGDEPLPDQPLPVDAAAWSRTLRGRHLDLYEHALALPRFGAALVLLSHDPC